MIAVVAALALAGDPSVVPVPIGRGPAFHPAPGSRPAPGLRCGPSGPTFRVHLELFAHRRVVVVPAGIGVGPGGCVYPLHTEAPTGVVEVERGARLRLGDLFRIWGRRLDARRLLSFASSTPVRAYVGGRRHPGPPSSILLTPQLQVVIEIGAYVPPHPSYLFPRRPS